MTNNKEQWSSRFGFIMAAAGSAIGLGNLWKFPYITGTNGGAVFLLLYIVFLVLLGIPILLSELSIGRFAGMNAVDSCKKINSKWGIRNSRSIRRNVELLRCRRLGNTVHYQQRYRRKHERGIFFRVFITEIRTYTVDVCLYGYYLLYRHWRRSKRN